MKRPAFRLLALLLALWLPYATGAGALMQGCAAFHGQSSMASPSTDTGGTDGADRPAECEEHQRQPDGSCPNCAGCPHSAAAMIFGDELVQSVDAQTDRVSPEPLSWAPFHAAPDFPPPDSLHA